MSSSVNFYNHYLCFLSDRQPWSSHLFSTDAKTPFSLRRSAIAVLKNCDYQRVTHFLSSFFQIFHMDTVFFPQNLSVCLIIYILSNNEWLEDRLPEPDDLTATEPLKVSCEHFSWTLPCGTARTQLSVLIIFSLLINLQQNGNSIVQCPESFYDTFHCNVTEKYHNHQLKSWHIIVG